MRLEHIPMPGTISTHG